MQSYRHSIPVSATRVKSSTGNHHNHMHEDSFSEDGIGSGGEPAFQTQNFLYELQSRCNNLEYEKTKNEMNHENAVNELRNKIDYLQLLSSNLSQQNQSLSEERDLLRMLLAEVREQNYSFSKEIGQLKLEINSIVCSTERDEGQQPQSLQFKSELLKKDHIIESLQRQLDIASDPKNHKEKSFQELEKVNKQLKEDIIALQQNQAKSILQLQQMRSKIKNKELLHEQERKRLLIELNSVKEQSQSKSRKYNNDINEELRRLSDLLQVKQQHIKAIENDRTAIETKINELTLEVGRLKCQKNNLQQLNQYLEHNAEENETKRKQLQQELFKNEKEMSDLRTQLFNQKIQLKKQINTQKLEFQEERIRYGEEMEEKVKEVNKLKEQNSYTNRHALDIQELSIKTQGIITDLDKANNQISKLTSENESLKLDLKTTQQKLQRKHQKYCNLEAKLKQQNSERVKALQASIYKLQQANNELEVKLEILQGRSGSQDNKADNSKELYDLLKSQMKEKDLQIKQLLQRVRQLQEGKKSLLDEISKLQGQARLARELKAIDFKEDRITTIQLLKEEISNLKEQISQQRQLTEAQRRQYNCREEKLRQQLQIKQKGSEIYVREKQLLENLIKKLEQELRSKEYRLDQLTRQLKTAKQEQQKYQQQITNLKLERQSTRNGVKGRKYSSEYVKSEKFKELGQEKSDQSELLDHISALQKENMSLKVDYSKSLQETNAILIRYQALQQKHRKIVQEKDKSSSNHQAIRIRVTQLENQCQRLRQIIAQQQVNEKHLVKVINELKEQKSSYSFSHANTKKPRRESEHLWLDKDFRVPERDINEIHNNYRHHKHRI